MTSLKKKVTRRRATWLARPKDSDLIVTILGLLLIAASFVIGVVLTLAPTATR